MKLFLKNSLSFGMTLSLFLTASAANAVTANPPVVAVPEPNTLALIGLGLAGLALRGFKK